MKLNKSQKEMLKSMKKDIKMVFFVRHDLKMGKGKIGAQCGHAAIGMYKVMLRKNPKLLDEWENSGCTKICLKVKGENDFGDILKYCEINGINHHQIIDAGRTQIAANSKTVLAIFEEQKKLNNLTHKYKLL